MTAQHKRPLSARIQSALGHIAGAVIVASVAALVALGVAWLWWLSIGAWS